MVSSTMQRTHTEVQTQLLYTNVDTARELVDDPHAILIESPDSLLAISVAEAEQLALSLLKLCEVVSK
ncbi:hypothetical protein [Halalkalibacter okhensis]|uniref:Uncharacterized protein n=1 Tax=Halalkalibacter okhensis TaxID=333138 RepID=A0A0B0IKZ2_9BACI|nr:hypothetical protein [Halalkalibacter okhensis]KHF40729.1 hypothetical protein LQ50_08070 [Halalkalibacter okhensis]